MTRFTCGEAKDSCLCPTCKSNAVRCGRLDAKSQTDWIDGAEAKAREGAFASRRTGPASVPKELAYIKVGGSKAVLATK